MLSILGMEGRAGVWWAVGWVWIISFKNEHLFAEGGGPGPIVNRSGPRHARTVAPLPRSLKLELGLIRLSELANADQLLYWGKITTTGSPYYIAVAIDFKGQYSFPHKKFYYRSLLLTQH